jgi:Ca2+-binding RTX toxin-like protein
MGTFWYGNESNILGWTQANSTFVWNDTIYLNGGNDQVLAGSGTDYVFGGTGNDTIYGQYGGDVLYGEADNDVIYGGLGGDFLFGGMGNDMLFGGEEADYIVGGLGNDRMYGGSGGDRFQIGNLSMGNDWMNGVYDVIMDFNRSEGDRLDFRNTGLHLNPGNLSFDHYGYMNISVAHINVNGYTASIEVHGVADLSAADFAFV